MSWMASLRRWAGDPWTRSEKEREADAISRRSGAAATGGTLNTEGHRRAVRLEAAESRRQRIIRRVIIVAVSVVACSAASSVFTRNRVPKAIELAATACARPVALYLGLRRDPGS